MGLDTFLLDLRRSEPVRAQGAPQLETEWYHVRAQGGTPHPVRLAWREGWLADLGHLRNRAHSAAVLGRLGERMDRLLRSTEWPAMLRRIQESRRDGRKVRLTISCGAAELLWLPWEALPTGGGTPLSALVGGPIRYCWPGTGTRPAPLLPHPDGGRMLLAVVGDERHRGRLHRALRAAAGSSGRSRFCDADQDVLHQPSLGALLRTLEQRERSGRPVTLLHLSAELAGSAEYPALLLGGPTEQHAPAPVTVAQLRDGLARFASSLRVVLLSLRGSAGGPPGVAGRIAQELHRTGIQLVAGPRIGLREDPALRLAEVVHRSLLRRTLPVEAALHEAVADLERKGHQADAAAIQLLVRPDSPDWTRPFAQRPHRGLAPYTIDDETFFVGRRREVDETLTAMEALADDGSPRLFALVGAPGVGKTSLALAGVAPRLLRSRRERWSLAVVDPALRPEVGLERALARRSREGGQLLIVVDGLEGLLSPEVAPEAARTFVNRLWRLVSSGTSGVTALVTLQVDSLGKLSRLPIEDLGASLDAVLYQERHRSFLAAPGPRALQHIIEEPVRAVGLRFEPQLVKALVSQAAREDTSLTALSAGLDLLWSARSGTVLQREQLASFGGLAGAVAAACERTWSQLPDDTHRRLAEGLLRSMVRGRGAEASPRPVLSAALRPASGEGRATFDRVVHALEDRGLVVRRFEGADEQLQLGSALVLQEWPRLREWLRKAAPAAAAPPPAAPAPRRRRSSLAWVASLLVLAVAAAGTVGWWGKRNKQRAEARSRFESARAHLADPTAATVLLRQIPPMLRPEGWREAANTALQSPHAVEVRRHDAPLRALDFDPAGTRLLTVADGIAQVGKPGEPPRDLRSEEVRGTVVAAAISPTGEHAITVNSAGAVHRWPVEDGPPELIVEGSGQGSTIAAFSPEGTHLLLARRASWELLSTDQGSITKGTVPLTRDGRSQSAVALAASDDGSRWAIATDAGQVVVWDMGRKRPQVHKHEGVRKLQLNPAGTHLLVTGAGGMRIIDLVRGVGSSRTPQSVEVNAASFGVDGRTIVVDYLDQDRGSRHLRMVDLVRRRDQIESPPLAQPATALASWGGELVFRGEADGTIRQLDSASGTTLRTFRGHKARISRLALSPDGSWLASTSLDGELRLWTVHPGARAMVRSFDEALADDSGAVLSESARFVGSRGADGAVRVWPVDAPDQAQMRGAAPDELRRIWISDDGSRVAARSPDGKLRVWGERSYVRELTGTVVAVDRGLAQAAVRGAKADLRLISLDSAESAPLELPEVVGARQARFDATGEVLAVGDGQGMAELRDARTGALRKRVQLAEGPTESVCVAPEGRALAAGSTDGGLRLWVAASDEVAELHGLTQRVRDCRFSDDGQRLIVQTEDAAQVWTLDGVAPQLELGVPTARAGRGAVAAFEDDATLVTVDAAGELRRWLLSADALHRGLWAATETCSIPDEDPVDLARWCACETCQGRTPAICEELDDQVKGTSLDTPEAWCPG